MSDHDHDVQTTRRVVLIYGPPAAGKTTKAREMGLPIFDRDESRWANEEAAFQRALAAIGTNPRAQAVVIRSGATASSRERWEQLLRPTDIIMLNPGRKECERRAQHRAREDRPGPIRSTMAAIANWFATHDDGLQQIDCTNPDVASAFKTW